LVVVGVQHLGLSLQLDLGDSSALVLHPEVLANLRSKPTGETFKAFSMDGQIETPVFHLERVSIGDVEFSNVAARADVHDETFLNYKKNKVGAVGFVGMGLFKAGQLLVDYSQRRLEISQPDSSGAVPSLCRGQPIALVADSTWGLTTAVGTDVGELQFVWDTGSPAMVMSRSMATEVGVAADVDSTVLKKFVIGGRNFGPQRVDIWDIPTPKGMAGLIGHPFFQSHVICVDGPAKALHIQ